MQTNRRPLLPCRVVVFTVAIFVISSNITTAAETISVPSIRPPPLISPVACTRDQEDLCHSLLINCRTGGFMSSAQRDQCVPEYKRCLATCH
jgi:hypothetical protein